MFGIHGRRMPRTKSYCLGSLLAGLVVFLLASPGMAQSDKLFYFYNNRVQDVDAWYNDVTIRPNSTINQFLFVVAPKEMNNARVELRGPDGKIWAKTGVMKFEQKGVIKLVEFLKAEEKKPAVTAEATPTAPGKTAAPPSPPGKQLTPVKLNGGDSIGFTFDLYLIEERTVAGKVEKQEYKEPVAISVLAPDAYLTANAYAQADGIRVVVTPVKDSVAFRDGKPSVITLSIPPQESLNIDALGAGTYRRTLQGSEASAVLEANELPIIAKKGDKATIRFNIDIDGYARAYVFEPTLSDLTQAAASKSQLLPSTEGAARLYLGNTPKQAKLNERFPARPLAKVEERYPVRVEIDNAAKNKAVKFTFDRGGQPKGNAGKPSQDEAETLTGPRDTKIWIDPVGDEGQLVITSVVTDWVVPLDTYLVRGAHKIGVEFEDRDGKSIQQSAYLLLDDTVPNNIQIIDLPDVQIKGQPLKLTANVTDKETAIKRVIFFVGPPPGPDGKRPSDPIKVEGVQAQGRAAIWSAEITLPPETKGILQVGLVATNEVGLEVTETKMIKLVDAPLPAGNLHVTVMRGNRPQAGIPVKLKDGEGKEKSVGVSDAKGLVKFDKLPPGLYSVAASKPDSGVGSKGDAVGKVEVDKTTEVTLTLKRGNP